MTSDFDAVLDSVQQMGGIGPATAESIRETFDDADAFIDACRDAYDDRDTEVLEQIDGIGRGYALGKFAFWAADEYGWTGGDAEPQEIEVKTGAEVLDDIPAGTPIVVNPVPEDDGTEEGR